METMMLAYSGERVSDYGSITGRGLGNLLGAPQADPVETLIRESLQNSWDARLPNTSKVSFFLDSWELDLQQSEDLRVALQSGESPHLIDDGPIRILAVTDRMTKGLGGPERPGIPTDGCEDFRNFVYMVGETKPLESTTGEVSGGTYGYGRSSFFKVSRSGTILVHSRYPEHNGDELASRTIGVAWTEPYSIGDERYTGRHFWGGERQDGWIGPITNSDSETFSKSLGFAPPEGTGTTVFILNPIFPEDHELSPAQQLVAALLRHAWPKIISNEVNLRIKWDGEELEIPDPRTHPELRLFTRAFDAATGTSVVGAKVFPIDILRPKAHLGQLGLARGPHSPNLFRSSAIPLDIGNPINDARTHHVALMRNNHLVINYRSSTAPLESEQYAGVFIVDPDVETVFARSEPPSHDAWVIERLTKAHEKSYVRVALRNIDDACSKFVQPIRRIITGTGSAAPLGALAKSFGSLLPDVGGSDESKRSNRKRSGSSSRRTSGPTINIVSIDVTEESAEIVRTLEFEVVRGAGDPAVAVSASLKVVTASGTEAIAKDSVGMPALIGWKFDELPFVPAKGAADTQVLDSSQSNGVVLISQPRDIEIQVNLEANALEGI